MNPCKDVWGQPLAVPPPGGARVNSMRVRKVRFERTPPGGARVNSTRVRKVRFERAWRDYLPFCMRIRCAQLRVLETFLEKDWVVASGHGP